MMANKRMKKMLAILLTAVMVLGVTQMTAFAGNAEEEEGEIIVVIPDIPSRPVIPSNPVRPNIPTPPVIIIEIEPEAPQIPEETVEEPEREYERPPRPRYQPKQDKEPAPAEEAPAEEIFVTDLPVAEPAEALTEVPVEEPAEALTEVPVEEPAEAIVEEIFEEEVPLADVPVTGDGTALYTALTLFSGTGLVWLARKKNR